MSDAALVLLVKQGDEGAFNMLMNRWHKKIHRFAYGFFGDAGEADEITQKTFIKVYQKLDTLEEPGKFSSWIYRITNNLCLDELKRAGRRKSTYKEGLAENSEVAHYYTPASRLEEKELGQLVQKALLTLPDEQKTVIILKEFEGLKFREIAEILREPENTVKSRMYYGLTALRKILTKWNIQNEYLNYD